MDSIEKSIQLFSGKPKKKKNNNIKYFQSTQHFLSSHKFSIFSNKLFQKMVSFNEMFFSMRTIKTK